MLERQRRGEKANAEQKDQRDCGLDRDVRIGKFGIAGDRLCLPNFRCSDRLGRDFLGVIPRYLAADSEEQHQRADSDGYHVMESLATRELSDKPHCPTAYRTSSRLEHAKLQRCDVTTAGSFTFK